MGEVIYEKGENYFFRTIAPCATNNILSLRNQSNDLKPH
jgi:hypothetical protein